MQGRVQIFAPITTETPRIAPSHSPSSVLFAATNGLPRGADDEIEVMADYVTRSNASTDDVYVPQPPASRWFLASAPWQALLGPLASLQTLGARGADWIINPYSYVVVSPNAPAQPIVQPASVRPKIAIGLGIDVW